MAEVGRVEIAVDDAVSLGDWHKERGFIHAGEGGVQSWQWGAMLHLFVMVGARAQQQDMRHRVQRVVLTWYRSTLGSQKARAPRLTKTPLHGTRQIAQ